MSVLGMKLTSGEVGAVSAFDPKQTSWGSEPARPIIVAGHGNLRLSERVDDAAGLSISERMDPTHGQV